MHGHGELWVHARMPAAGPATCVLQRTGLGYAYELEVIGSIVSCSCQCNALQWHCGWHCGFTITETTFIQCHRSCVP